MSLVLLHKSRMLALLILLVFLAWILITFALVSGNMWHMVWHVLVSGMPYNGIFHHALASGMPYSGIFHHA